MDIVIRYYFLFFFLFFFITQFLTRLSFIFIEERPNGRLLILFKFLCSLYSVVRARLLIIKWKYVFTAANNSWINIFFFLYALGGAHIKHCVYIKMEFVRFIINFFFREEVVDTFYGLQPAMKAEILVCSLVHLPKMDYCSSWQQKWLLASLHRFLFRWKFHAVIIGISD